ncbi:5-carboxymethyl-2-hydroxymuconate Delta-isomerase [Streptomyces caatingaensis]|uniref:5-carboxymethyl-2-hydroxymuconate delta isomerase n=1 Tax=Streptomyces caatingaensis TaxID=1678637 RepID=A0A0K9XL88_9ACTN|nr:hypothetical protein [Streptomyces caatingaensis]KNB54115.1 hypothetical protein AC230_06225 [Streptomyces caatingaensis]
MPHITVDCTAQVRDRLTRRAFTERLNALVVGAVDSAGTCKIFLRAATETFVVGGSGGGAFVHVDIGLLAGRTEEQKGRLSEAVLSLLDELLGADGGGEPVLSVEVRDLAPSYRLSRGGRRMSLPVPAGAVG